VILEKEFQAVEGSNNYTMPVKELNAGLYLLRLVTDDGVLTRKIMISQ